MDTIAQGMGATAMGDSNIASGDASTAMGQSSLASGHTSTAMGQSNTASGFHSTAMGFGTTAEGDESTAMGGGTHAKAGFSTTMGQHITASENESLAVSGNVHAKNVQIRADGRMTVDVRPANTSAILEAVRRMQVVEHGHSANYCTHLGLSAEACAAVRRTGFIAQQVASAAPDAVSSGTSLRLMNASKQNRSTAAAVELERVDDVQSIDVHTMLGQLVGALQELNQRQQQQNDKQQRQIGQLQERIVRQQEQLESQHHQTVQLQAMIVDARR